MTKCCLVLGLIAFAVEAHAQALISRPLDTAPSPAPAAAPSAPSDSSVAVFRVGVDVVALNVVVTDPQQRFVSGLSADDFAVYEDGVQQEISFFAASHVPLDLALLLDTSASMHDKMDTMRVAALGFLDTLRKGDRAAIVEIKDVVRMSSALGYDIDEARAAVAATAARGGTALYNGLYLALKEMVKQRRSNVDVRRQAIAVLSDGEDTASLVGYEDVMQEAKQAGITIYTIALKSAFELKRASVSSRRYFSEAEFAMKALAQETGARAFFPENISELPGIYGVIADELAHQYAIGYTPRNGRRDGAFRRVIVRVAERPDARTRTRSGYTAARPASNQ